MLHDQKMDYPWWNSPWSSLQDDESIKLTTAHSIYEATGFPAHTLPPVLRDVVVALSRDVDAPIELISGTVLSAVSLACQGFIEIQIPDGKKKPCSIYNLILADSGERKSTIHALVMKPFLDFEKKDKEVWEDALKNYNIDMLIWNSHNKNVLKKINKKINQGEEYQAERQSLVLLNAQKPKQPKRMRLIYTDTTPEAMQRGLYDNIPSAGYISAEASVFFEGRAKNNLGFLNELWDGAPIEVERRSKESFSVVNARFSMLLLVQNDIFNQYFKKYGMRATGSGFLSRFLISAVPGGTIRRLSSTNPVNSQELTLFHERINELLLLIQKRYQYNKQEDGQQIVDKIEEQDEQGNDITIMGIVDEHNPKVLYLSQNSQRALEHFYNEIAMAAHHYRDNNTIKPWILKLAENTLRIAGLLQYFTDENKEEICDEIFFCAMNIAKYYYRNTISLFLTTFASPEEDADVLYSWLKIKLSPIDVFKGVFDDLNQKRYDNDFPANIDNELKIQCIKRAEIQRLISKSYLRKDGARLNKAIRRLEDDRKIYIKRQENTNGRITEYIYLQ